MEYKNRTISTSVCTTMYLHIYIAIIYRTGRHACISHMGSFICVNSRCAMLIISNGPKYTKLELNKICIYFSEKNFSYIWVTADRIWWNEWHNVMWYQEPLGQDFFGSIAGQFIFKRKTARQADFSLVQSCKIMWLCSRQIGGILYLQKTLW